MITTRAPDGANKCNLCDYASSQSWFRTVSQKNGKFALRADSTFYPALSLGRHKCKRDPLGGGRWSHCQIQLKGITGTAKEISFQDRPFLYPSKNIAPSTDCNVDKIQDVCDRRRFPPSFDPLTFPSSGRWPKVGESNQRMFEEARGWRKLHLFDRHMFATNSDYHLIQIILLHGVHSMEVNFMLVFKTRG